jgi:pentatricopeptide repeat protein
MSWNVMIAGLAQHGCSKDVLELFEQVKHGGFTPNTVTFVGLLSACSHTGLVDEGCEFFLPMCGDYSLMPAAWHYGCMVDYLSVLGSWMTLRSSSTKCHWMQIHQSGTECSVLAEFMATYS